MLSRDWNRDLSVSDLSKLHQLSKGLLDALNENWPDRVGGANGWNFRCADGHASLSASCRSSHVYEINDWLWNFGRPQPRVGALSVARMERIHRKSKSETVRHPGALGRPGHKEG